MPGFALKQKDFQTDDAVSITEAIHETVGQKLRAARENRGEDLADISRTLRISESYLLALEDDDRSGLPEIVYTIGFLKTYAFYLSLNSEELVAGFKQQFTQSIRSETLVFPLPTAERSIPTKTLVIVATCLSLLIALSWTILKPTPEAVDEFQHLSPIEIADSVETIQPVPVETATESPLSASTDSNIEAAASNETPAALLPTSEGKVEFSQAHPIFPMMDMRPRNETIAAAIVLKGNDIYLDQGKSFTIQANETSWVEIKNEKGDVIFTKTLKEGESQELPALPNQVFSTANAAGVSFYVDGKYFTGLGKTGEVLKNKSLHFETFQDASSTSTSQPE